MAITIKSPCYKSLTPKNISVGQSVRLNGRPSIYKVVFVTGSIPALVGLEGPRGGDVLLHHSVDGTQVEASKGFCANGKRERINLIEISS